jgi:hypothetical protein
MLCPGLLFTEDRVTATVGAGQTPDYRNAGFGFMNNGSLAVDTNAAAGSTYYNGFRMSANGAVYGVASGTIANWIEGVPVTADGAICYEGVASVRFTSGNPITANGFLATIAPA